MSLRKIALGTAAISSTNVLRLLAQFLVIPVLSRLLSPADYGVVAIAMPFVLFTMMLADAGIGRSLIRTPISERGVWSTCFWLSTAIGVILAMLVAALAPLAALAYNEPRLSSYIVVLTFVVVAQAVCAIPTAALQQQQRFSTLAFIDISALIVSTSTALVIAFSGGGAWALVAQQIALYAVRLLMTLSRSRFCPLLVWELHNAWDHLIFGRDVLATAMIGFFSRSIDTLIVGKVLPTAAVGIYSMAFQFARLPAMLVTGPLQYVLYAYLVHLKHNRAAIATTFLLLTRVLAVVIFPAMGMIAAAHKPLFTLLLSAKWSESGYLFMIAAPACALQAVTGLAGPILMVLGRTDILIKTNLEFGLCWLLALVTSVSFGLKSAILSYDIIVFIYTPRLLWLLLPLIGSSMGLYLRTIHLPALITPAWALLYAICNHFLVMEEWAQVALAATFAGTAIISAAFLQRNTLRAEIDLCRQTHGQESPH